MLHLIEASFIRYATVICKLLMAVIPKIMSSHASVIKKKQWTVNVGKSKQSNKNLVPHYSLISKVVSIEILPKNRSGR